jgi:AAA+ ATPase superfamily predicted ATPase
MDTLEYIRNKIEEAEKKAESALDKYREDNKEAQKAREKIFNKLCDLAGSE